MQRVHRFHSQDLFIRAAAVISTPVVRDMATVQQMGPLATMASGRAVTGALLMASVLRDKQVIGFHFKGDGPLGSVYAEASYEGEARGWCDHPEADVPLKDGHLDVARGIGQGFLHVTRSQPFEKAPHVSSVELVSGEVGDDLAYYLHQSLQIPSVIALGTVMDDHGRLMVSGGVVMELMPGAPDRVINALEQSVAKASSLSELLRSGADAEALLRNYTADIPMQSMPHEHDIKYSCRCSMDRVERSLTLVGPEPLRDMIREGRDVSIRCEFCGRSYLVSVQRLTEIHSGFDVVN